MAPSCNGPSSKQNPARTDARGPISANWLLLPRGALVRIQHPSFLAVEAGSPIAARDRAPLYFDPGDPSNRELTGRHGPPDGDGKLVYLRTDQPSPRTTCSARPDLARFRGIAQATVRSRLRVDLPLSPTSPPCVSNNFQTSLSLWRAPTLPLPAVGTSEPEGRFSAHQHPKGKRARSAPERQGRPEARPSSRALPPDAGLRRSCCRRPTGRANQVRTHAPAATGMRGSRASDSLRLNPHRVV
jgi:hypothetical protein